MAYATTYSPPGSVADQRFIYTCLGTEGSSFTIAFPVARADTNYVAVASLASTVDASQYLVNAPPAGYTTTSIAVITGEAVSAGDKIAVIVTEVA